MGLFAGKMGFATFYTATETVAPPGRKNFRWGQSPQAPTRFNEVKMQDLIESSGEAEAATAVTVTGGAPAAVSRAEVARTVVPRAAAQNTPTALAR